MSLNDSNISFRADLPDEIRARAAAPATTAPALPHPWSEADVLSVDRPRSTPVRRDVLHHTAGILAGAALIVGAVVLGIVAGVVLSCIVLAVIVRDVSRSDAS